MYYSAIGLLAILILFIENQDILWKNDRQERSALKAYRYFLFSVLLYYITDTLWGVFEALKIPGLLFADTSVYYITMALGVLFWSQYVIAYMEEDNRFGRIFIYAGRIVACVITVFSIINIFVPVLFTVDRDCVYHALPVRHILLAVQIALLLFVSVYASSLIMRRDSGKRNSRYESIAFFGMIMAVFLTGQMWSPYLPLYTIGYLLGTSLLRTFVIGDEKAEYKSELKEAEKIRLLKQSITSLLDNMPALSFSKDANTGVYLACNQAFAEYAHKKDPDGVVGLTDAEIFDSVTASHFVEDDKMALSMEEPYIFFEDVPDAAGNQRQFQTTKLKFYDAVGRLCLLGMCQDVTDMVRIRRENATTKEAYEKAKSTGLIFTHIAQALARGYSDIYYVNVDSGEYVEYRSDENKGGLIEIRNGKDFFGSCKIEGRKYVFEDDCENFINSMDKKTLLDTLDRNNTFTMAYRLKSPKGPVYVSMRVSRFESSRFIVIGITDVDEEMKQRRFAERIKEERIAYTRINALAGDFLCVYVVVPETGRYREFSTTEGLDNIRLPKEGLDFFEDAKSFFGSTVYAEDLDHVLNSFTKENVLSDIGKNGIYAINYRFRLAEGTRYVQLKAAMVEESEGRRLVVGLNDIDALIRQETEYAKQLSKAQTRANTDALTGVKTKMAFKDDEEHLDKQIKAGNAPAFAVVILDVNNLKKVNDSFGHQAGDKYIKDACRVICNSFKHSPVYRVGGDEFAVIVKGSDYKRLNTLMGDFNVRNEEAAQNDGIVIACGMSEFMGDECLADVYKRADMNMYANKNWLKNLNED